MIVQTSKQSGCSDCRRVLGRALDARLFRALADPTRLQILLRLIGCSDGCSVSDAANGCRVDLSVASRHLALLRAAGIVEMEKEGRCVRHVVRYARLSRALRTLADAIDACCPDAGACCPTGAAIQPRGASRGAMAARRSVRRPRQKKLAIS